MKIIPIVLCGGYGKRIWPLSSEDYPKQFLPLFGELNLFQQSIQRILKINEFDIFFQR